MKKGKSAAADKKAKPAGDVKKPGKSKSGY